MKTVATGVPVGPVLALLVVPVAVSLAAATVVSQPFRARVDVVQVTATVLDANGRLVKGLTKDDFEIWEDGVPERVAQFTADRVPVSVGILLDASDSMRGQPIVDARDGVDQFLERLEPRDEAFVATFNHDARLAARWRQPPSALKHVLDGVRPSGGTAIWDALAEASSLFDRRLHARAAFVVVSDGADTASDRSVVQALDVIRRSDAFVYAIAIDPPDARGSTRVNPESLRDITSWTGGYTEVVQSTADLGPATARIAEELNAQYTIGYSSSKPPDGSWRSIRVRAGDYRVRARRGYFATPPR